MCSCVIVRSCFEQKLSTRDRSVTEPTTCAASRILRSRLPQATPGPATETGSGKTLPPATERGRHGTGNGTRPSRNRQRNEAVHGRRHGNGNLSADKVPCRRWSGGPLGPDVHMGARPHDREAVGVVGSRAHVVTGQRQRQPVPAAFPLPEPATNTAPDGQSVRGREPRCP